MNEQSELDNKESELLQECSKYFPDPKIVSELLLGGSSPNLKNIEGKSSLGLVCSSYLPSVELVELLLAYSANPNVLTNKSQSCLHLACANETVSLDIVKLLISHGADPNLKDDKERLALHYACERDSLDLKMIKLLSGVSLINSKDENNESPLYILCDNCKSDLDMIECLVSQGANPNIESINTGHCALSLMLTRERDSVVNFLLENGADPVLAVECFFARGDKRMIERLDCISKVDWEKALSVVCSSIFGAKISEEGFYSLQSLLHFIKSKIGSSKRFTQFESSFFHSLCFQVFTFPQHSQE